jgi:hypothetical protein
MGVQHFSVENCSKNSRGRPRHRWDGNIKVTPKNIWYEAVDWAGSGQGPVTGSREQS